LLISAPFETISGNPVHFSENKIGFIPIFVFTLDVTMSVLILNISLLNGYDGTRVGGKGNLFETNMVVG
jgi:hypothetical protein